MGRSGHRRGFLTSLSVHLTVTTILSSGYLPASLSSLANGASRLIEKQQQQKQKTKKRKHNYFLCPFFLSDFYCQDHGREKALLFIRYVLLSIYYVPGTRGTMINKTGIPFTESFRSVH